MIDSLYLLRQNCIQILSVFLYTGHNLFVLTLQIISIGSWFQLPITVYLYYEFDELVQKYDIWNQLVVRRENSVRSDTFNWIPYKRCWHSSLRCHVYERYRQSDYDIQFFCLKSIFMFGQSLVMLFPSILRIFSSRAFCLESRFVLVSF